MLHLAPEECLEPIFRKAAGEGYVSADLSSPRAMVKANVTGLPYPDECFDVIHCSHVLEHVPDDMAAMRELHRVLKTGGCALLMVPTREGPTLEDPSITDPRERARLFGQEDHVRFYGRDDFACRLRETGFQVRIVEPGEVADEEEARRMGLPADEAIYVCTRTTVPREADAGGRTSDRRRA